jgi:hypothetical protein
MRPVLAALVLPSAAFAQTIDFETIPGLRGEAPEGLPISDQFDVAPFHVRFQSLKPGLVAQPLALVRLGAPRSAFRGESQPGCDGLRTSDDKVNRSAPYDPGCFFATDDGLWGTGSPPLQSVLVSYSIPVMQASGYVLDLDDEEEYTLHARDANEVDVTAPIVLDRHGGSGGNGQASFWFFDVREPIHSILLDYTGRGGSKGIGFDEFAPATACPGQVVHRGNGLAGASGRVPAISMTCPQVGRPGSIEVFNGAPGTRGCLVISLFPTTRPFCGSSVPLQPMLERAHVLSGRRGSTDEGRFSQSYGPIPASMAGVTLYVQSGYVDPGAPCRGVSLTEALEGTVR